ncbi:DUF2607 domain-containing protein [Vibrio sp. ZSDE26]|uniref:DUF2607 domain-containing protein n=1 Tax=Vibrio amylolyticus TaxID=2847292 RepID=A0A9X1XLJ1_9VIBR|nr:DUF2607 family protein [Vibrio amylolyticus]MCK6263095.1 DUF2607 domain-containing protein [Vibrio amylolyticus]
MIKPITSIQRLLTLGALVGVLWLNFAAIEHQFDFHPDHHSDHHCQLFSAVSHGLNQHASAWANLIARDVFSFDYTAENVVIGFHAYMARSPPNSTNLKTVV